ncbi:PAC2 family protein [Halolamina pelagica]|uniref:PAC2 family protein n=1 Tax=Halolamina pelagica TaxID=699431 RepID=A0A0P7HBD0_9EURY|nr:PAC2 family protein [Halolamina pelagica]KPN30761.1 PAC2 family protein [Halolamina pelagica]
MDPIDIETVADPDLREPVLVEGLPGVGHVGKLAAEHLLEEFESTLVRRVYADEFPPQVDVDDDGVASLTHASFHAVDLSSPTPTDVDEDDDEAEDGDEEADADDENPEGDALADGGAVDEAEDGEEGENGDEDDDPGTVPTDRDLLVLTGNHQAGSNKGHYQLTEAFLDVAEGFGVEEAYALGGVPTGELIEEHNVLGAVSEPALTDSLSDAGVEFRGDEPAGGIVGVSGLLLGLGGRRDLDVACLMGETSGYLVDPKSAQAVLETLEQQLDFRVDFAALEKRAEEMEEVVSKIQQMQEGSGAGPSDEELRYIG